MSYRLAAFDEAGWLPSIRTELQSINHAPDVVPNILLNKKLSKTSVEDASSVKQTYSSAPLRWPIVIENARDLI